MGNIILKKILVILLLVFAFGCNDSTGPVDESVVGMWTKEIREDIFVIEFIQDGKYKTFNISEGKQEVVVNGTYSVSSNIITMNDTKCEDEEGKYSFDRKNEGIEFVLIEDECNRNEVMPGFFKKYDVLFVSPNPIMNDVSD